MRRERDDPRNSHPPGNEQGVRRCLGPADPDRARRLQRDRAGRAPARHRRAPAGGGAVRGLLGGRADRAGRRVPVQPVLAVRAVRGPGRPAAPIPARPADRFYDDLVSIQKYAGKTNEYFTKLLLNVTALASATPGDLLDRRLAVLDPLCGRGTTLNQALMYGFDAAGVDLDRKDFDAYSAFIQTWLKQKRIKHRAEAGPVRRNRAVVARRLQVTLGATKERYKAGEVSTLTMVNADTSRCLEFFRPASFDLLVTDAPYGVQHGSRARQVLSRRPTELLAEVLPVWAQLLRPGGAVGIAWNTHLARRDDLVLRLTDCGLQVLDAPPYLDFAHRVDQAIDRDLIVARKPR